jgi:hypothetical protein
MVNFPRLFKQYFGSTNFIYGTFAKFQDYPGLISLPIQDCCSLTRSIVRRLTASLNSLRERNLDCYSKCKAPLLKSKRPHETESVGSVGGVVEIKQKIWLIGRILSQFSTVCWSYVTEMEVDLRFQVEVIAVMGNSDDSGDLAVVTMVTVVTVCHHSHHSHHSHRCHHYHHCHHWHQCVDVLMTVLIAVLMFRCFDVLMTVWMCWCSDVLRVDVLMFWCFDCKRVSFFLTFPGRRIAIMRLPVRLRKNSNYSQ